MLLTKELLKENPKFIEEFINWYPNYCNEYTCMPDMDTFFDMAFKFQASTWIDFFYDMGIIISNMGEETIVWLNPIKTNRYNLTPFNNKTLFEIHSSTDPSIVLETAIARLIELIQKPF